MARQPRSDGRMIRFKGRRTFELIDDHRIITTRTVWTLFGGLSQETVTWSAPYGYVWRRDDTGARAGYGLEQDLHEIQRRHRHLQGK